MNEWPCWIGFSVQRQTQREKLSNEWIAKEWLEIGADGLGVLELVVSFFGEEAEYQTKRSLNQEACIGG